MKKLIFADPFLRPTGARLLNAVAEDRYYGTHEPKSVRRMWPLASISAIAAFLAIAFDLPR